MASGAGFEPKHRHFKVHLNYTAAMALNQLHQNMIVLSAVNVFLKKCANPGLFFVYFCSFLVTISIQIEKACWCAWDSNPGPQDSRCRQNHRAMAVNVIKHFWTIFGLFICSTLLELQNNQQCKSLLLKMGHCNILPMTGFEHGPLVLEVTSTLYAY